MAVHAVLGGDLAWVADNDPDVSQILAHRFPDVPNLGDITKVDWFSVEAVDILVAGTPCQMSLQAGARAGLRAGTRSGGCGSRPCMPSACCGPVWCCIENVLGLLTARGDDPTAEHVAAEARRDALERLAEWLQTAREHRGSEGGHPSCQAVQGRGPLASWDSESRQWLAADGMSPDLFEQSEPFSGRWPAWGSMRAGQSFQQPTPGHPTSGNGSSSSLGLRCRRRRRRGTRTTASRWSPGEARKRFHAGKATDATRAGTPLAIAAQQLLRTPTAQLATNGGSQHPDKRRAGGHQPTLADQVEHELLPTPTAADGERGSATYCRGNPTLKGALLPTPRATDGTKGGPNQHGSSGDLMLPSAVMTLLPTPRPQTKGGGASADPPGRLRGPDNPGGHSPNLMTTVSALLPTPTARDAKGQDLPSRAGGQSLPAALLPTPSAALLPTPRAQDARHWAATDYELDLLHVRLARSSGDHTLRRSPGGRPSSDGLRHVQLSLDEPECGFPPNS